MKKEKNYFASANTGKNFVNYFNYINQESKKGFQYILKGGPGTGKSTLMKKVGQYFLDKDLDVEYFWCSSDTDSLDGVRIPEYNISVIDGTAPHSFDASFPSIKQKIVDLGEYIGDDVKHFEETIFDELEKKQIYFDIAYSYLNSALNIYQINKNVLKKNMAKNYIFNKINKLINKLNIKNNKNQGNDRKLFLKAFSNEGILNLENLNNFNSILETNFDIYECPILLENLVEKLNKLGYDTISFFNPIDPENRESIFIPKINIYIKNNYLINKKINNFNKLIEKNNYLINNLTQFAGENINNAKLHHKKVEEFYIKNMSFDGLNLITNNLIKRIENMANYK